MTPTESVPVAILSGGRGTRLRGGGPSLPKPLVEIGGHPILWHVVRLHAPYKDAVMLNDLWGRGGAPWTSAVATA